MDDNGIIELYERRDEAAIAETDRAYGSRLGWLAENILTSREDAQECVSDTYMTAWRSIPPQRPQRFFAWLAKICRNGAFGVLDRRGAAKRSAVTVELTAEMEQCIPDRLAHSDIEKGEITAVINNFLRSLSAQDSAIFVRRYFFAASIRDLASERGMTEGAVKTRLHRLREALRKKLSEEEIFV